MHLFDSAYVAGANEALAKYAATRAHKEIGKSMQSGDMARAHRLSTMPGLLSNSPQAQQYGHQLKYLGRGGEGMSHAVAHPQHGAVARKMYDPAAGSYSPEMIQRKEQLSPLPNTAAYIGKSQTSQGTPIHYTEFVPGQKIDKGMMSHPPFAQQFAQAKAQTTQAGHAQGRELRDLRPGNAMRTPDGKVKFIDHMPFNRDEVIHPAQEAYRRALPRGAPGHLPEWHMPGNERSQDLFPNAGVDRTSTTNDQFNRYMYRGEVTGQNPDTLRPRRIGDFAAMNSHIPKPSPAPGPLGPQAADPHYGPVPTITPPTLPPVDDSLGRTSPQVSRAPSRPAGQGAASMLGL